jgi:hypothetical protein
LSFDITDVFVPFFIAINRKFTIFYALCRKMVKKLSRKTPGLLKAFAFLPLFCPSPRTAPARAGAAEPAASYRENASFFLMTGMAMPYAKSTPFVLLVAENTLALPMSILPNLPAASHSPCDATRRANPRKFNPDPPQAGGRQLYR